MANPEEDKKARKAAKKAKKAAKKAAKRKAAEEEHLQLPGAQEGPPEVSLSASEQEMLNARAEVWQSLNAIVKPWPQNTKSTYKLMYFRDQPHTRCDRIQAAPAALSQGRVSESAQGLRE